MKNLIFAVLAFGGALLWIWSLWLIFSVGMTSGVFMLVLAGAMMWYARKIPV